MTKYEITFDQYDQFCKENRWDRPEDEGWGRGTRPVINVAWHDAVMYAAWLSRKTGHTYRLPTEAEWEYAARAGTPTTYWWGDVVGSNQANCAGCGSEFGGRRTAPVGTFQGNPWGLHDTAGNVWEWTSSRRFETPQPGWQAALGFYIIRGGSWSRNAAAAGAGYRVFNSQGFRGSNLGFRLVRAGLPPAQLQVSTTYRRQSP